MGWLIGRQEATSQPELARRKVLALLGNIGEIPDPEQMLLDVLVDAVLLVESYRGARHQPTLVPELQKSVDALLREVRINERLNEWAREPVAAGER